MSRYSAVCWCWREGDGVWCQCRRFRVGSPLLAGRGAVMSLTSGFALHLALPLALAFLTLATRFTLSFADEVCAPRL